MDYKKAAKRNAAKERKQRSRKKHRTMVEEIEDVVEEEVMEIEEDEDDVDEVCEKMDIDRQIDGTEYQMTRGTDLMNSDKSLFDTIVDEARLLETLKEHLYEQTLVDEDLETHRARVCVVCDRFIIGTEAVEFISGEELLEHQSRLGVTEYEAYHGPLRPSLRKQYQVDDEKLHDLLLSPRSRREGRRYVCCEQCKESLRDTPSRRIIGPPKHSIANGFVIGEVPEETLKEEEITELLSALIAPIRPFMHVISYMGGQHKTIRGHVMLFHNDIIHTGSVIQNYLRTGANPNVYCVLCGTFTPNQREIINQRVALNLGVWKRLLHWYITDSGHEAFRGLNPDIETWPRPHVVEEKSNENNTDEEGDPSIEETVEGATYHFPSAYEPTEDAGVYQSQEKFARSMLHRTAPTLLFHPGNFASERDVPLESVLPLAFISKWSGRD